MANTNSPNVALFHASPASIADHRDGAVGVQRERGVVEFTPTADDDTLQIAILPTDAVLDSMKFAFDDLGTGITLNIGLYQVGDSSGPGAVIDEDELVTLVDVATAAVAMTEYRYETKGIETTGQTLWELAGLSAAPDYGQFVLVVTVAGDTTAAAGTVAWIIDYTL